MAKKKAASKKKAVSKKAATKKKAANSKTDIVELILKHHKPLKSLIKTMKSDRADYQKKKAAFDEFVPALMSHAKPEEQCWYENLKTEHDMKVEGIEGDTEHALADLLVGQLKTESDEDTFTAKVKVLAELVEHHIEEEEEEMLPEYKKVSTPEERASVGQRYLVLCEQFLKAAE